MDTLLRQFATQHSAKDLQDLAKSAVEAGYLSHRLDDLDFDSSENRLFGETLSVANRVIEAEYIKIKNSTTISFRNCIFFGSLIILSESGSVHAYLDNCIIAKELRFLGCTAHRVELNQCNIDCVHLYNSRVELCDMSSCNIGVLDFDEAQIAAFHTFCNRISFCTKYRSRVGIYNFSSDILEVKNIITNQRHVDIDLLQFVDISLDEMIGRIKDPQEVRIETIDFLKNSPSMHKSKSLEQLADLHLAMLSYNGKLTRGFIWLLQGFNKPSVILAYAIAVLVVFALLYWQFGSFSTGTQVTSFWQALYFSGVTFTTVGYGDIQPVAFTRVLAVIEGFMGMLLSSAVLVSMVNRFTKK